jgi:hypothetical protein
VIPAELDNDDGDAKLDTWAAASGVFERWFLERWQRVQEKFAPMPAVMGHHDSYFKTDLNTGTRTNMDEVLKAARAKPKSTHAARPSKSPAKRAR